jgi:3-amino-5-hydroxybenzoate synthase
MGALASSGGVPVRAVPWPEWPVADASEREKLLNVLESGHWWSTEGSEVTAFETEFAAFCGAGSCMAVTNGSHAIEVALLAAGIGAGDEVIVPDYTFFATAAAVAAVNAVPMPVDIDPATLCIDPDAVAAAISHRTRAVIAVHLAGHPADLDRLGALCARYDLVLLEDCAHAHGSRWRDRPVGSFGAAGTFSFQQSKLMTAGEGGAVVSTDAGLAARIRSYADCGRRPGEWFYSHFALGGNCRLSEWQAAVLRAQLARFPAQNARRNANALYLNDALAEIPGVRPQQRDPRTTSQGHYCYVVTLDEATFGLSRDLVHDALVAEGMPLTVSYPPIHRIAAFTQPEGLAPRHRDCAGWPDYAALSLPHSRAAAATTLWFRHALLLGERADVAQLVEALDKVRRHADEVRKRVG